MFGLPTRFVYSLGPSGFAGVVSRGLTITSPSPRHGKLKSYFYENEMAGAELLDFKAVRETQS